MSEDDFSNAKTPHGIVKLNENNYQTWAKRMQWVLDEKDLWEIVSGAEKAPTVAASSSVIQEGLEGGEDDIPPAPQVSTAVFEVQLKAYIKKCKQARSLLGTTITDAVMTYIEAESDPAKMWSILEERYNPRSKVTLVQRIRELTTAKMDDAVDIEAHIQHMVLLKRMCEEQGEKLSDTIFTGILLNSLSDEYSVVIILIESQGELTPDQAINKIMEEARKRRNTAMTRN